MCNMGSLFIAYLEESGEFMEKINREINSNGKSKRHEESSVNLHYFTCTLHSDTLNEKVKSTHDFQH